jgi:hypothetical protein
MPQRQIRDRDTDNRRCYLGRRYPSFRNQKHGTAPAPAHVHSVARAEFGRNVCKA